MTKKFILQGSIQNYDWGGRLFIPQLLGQVISEVKCAEYWMGAHSKAPSNIVAENGSEPLDHFLNSNLEEYLGKQVATTFEGLPYLFKVLDVQQMLSIQVHPTKKEAEEGFRKENEIGIPMASPIRNFKDDNHKPELMVALSEFWLLHGFLPADKLVQVLESIPEFSHFTGIFKSHGYKGLYSEVMEESLEQTNKVLGQLIHRILPMYHADDLDKSNPDYWAAQAYLTFCSKGNMDKGMYSIYFFNLVRALPGQAVFQDAGIPHAYLEGQCMELMANSDNVLRGGLTTKNVDVPELLKHINFEAKSVNILTGVLASDGLERIYKCPIPDFELSTITLTDEDVYHSKSDSGEILLLLEGELEISENNSEIKLEKGQALFLTSNCDYKLTTSSKAIIYKAKTPS